MACVGPQASGLQANADDCKSCESQLEKFEELNAAAASFTAGTPDVDCVKTYKKLMEMTNKLAKKGVTVSPTGAEDNADFMAQLQADLEADDSW